MKLFIVTHKYKSKAQTSPLLSFTVKHLAHFFHRYVQISARNRKQINQYFLQLQTRLLTPVYLQAISCKMPVKVNLWPLGRVNSWATNTNKARIAKTQASTEVAWTVWRYSATAGRKTDTQSVKGRHEHRYKAICITTALITLLTFIKLLLVTYEHVVELYQQF